jgi:hypothetical protein
MTAILAPETVMACAIKVLTHTGKPVLIEEVSGLFATLRREHIEDVGKVALRRVPHGLYSEDVEAFFGRLLASDLAKACSPLTVTPQGLQLCQELIDEENQSHPDAFAKVAKALGYDLEFLTNPAGQQKPA